MRSRRLMGNPIRRPVLPPVFRQIYPKGASVWPWTADLQKCLKTATAKEDQSFRPHGAPEYCQEEWACGSHDTSNRATPWYVTNRPTRTGKKMTRFTSLALAAALLGSVSAHAADLAPAPVEPYAPTVLPFSWTGFYVGAHAGYGTGSSDIFIEGKGGGDFGDWSSDGFFGGAQIGYNQQFGAFV